MVGAAGSTPARSQPKKRKPRGRHPQSRLTALALKRLKAGKHADGNGLYLIVDASGARRWLFRTVVRLEVHTEHGLQVRRVRREIGLGSLALVTVDEARAEAVRLRRLARAGGDPLAERRRTRDPRQVPTFEQAARSWHESHASVFRNPSHRQNWLGSIERHVFPVFGPVPVDQVTAAHVLTALEPIWATKRETARRVRSRVKTVLAWAKTAGFRTGDNPVDGVHGLPKARTRVRHHPAMPYASVPRFIVDLRAATAAAAVRLALEFVILTASRTSEVLGARWEEMDDDAAVWTVPADRIKAGREQRVPLSPRCIAILKRAATLRTDDSPFVFGGRRAGRGLSDMALLMLLRRLRGRKTVVVHGFRSSFRDWAAERTSFPRAVVEAALAHVVVNKVEAAYLRTDYLDLRRELMQQWATFATTPPAKVASLAARRKRARA